MNIERRYTASLDVSDGRTLVGRCVPYNEPATVADDGSPAPYVEVIRHGAFRRSVRAPHRVMLNYEHRTDLGNVVGPCVELVERDDGLHGTFRVVDGTLGDHTLELVRSGAVTGMSITAAVHPNGTHVVDGIVERTLLALEAVALTNAPAYASAGVLAVRSGTTWDVEPERLAQVLARTAELRAIFNR